MKELGEDNGMVLEGIKKAILMIPLLPGFEDFSFKLMKAVLVSCLGYKMATK